MIMLMILWTNLISVESNCRDGYRRYLRRNIIVGENADEDLKGQMVILTNMLVPWRVPIILHNNQLSPAKRDGIKFLTAGFNSGAVREWCCSTRQDSTSPLSSLAMPAFYCNKIMVCKELPKGQYFDRISINVKGIVTKHNNKSGGWRGKN